MKRKRCQFGRGRIKHRTKNVNVLSVPCSPARMPVSMLVGILAEEHGTQRLHDFVYDGR
jgi:hypothetical protein